MTVHCYTLIKKLNPYLHKSVYHLKLLKKIGFCQSLLSITNLIDFAFDLLFFWQEIAENAIQISTDKLTGLR